MNKITHLLRLLPIEYRSLFDFFAIAFIVGILSAFSGVNIPDIILVPVVIILLLFLCQKRGYIFRPIIFLLLLVLLGIGLTNYRIRQVSSPILEKPLYDVEITGTIEATSHLMETQKITLNNVRFLNQPFGLVPKKLRLTYAHTDPVLHTGDFIRFKANIRPPLKPAFFASYHEAHTLYFEEIGAVGKIQEILSLRETTSSFQKEIEKIRTQICNRLQEVLPEEPARIAIPLTIGEQSVLTKELYTLFRSAGIIHILSISGFHLSLLATFVFFMIRGFLSFFPSLAERLSAKKTAAILALLSVTGYILISGMQIPAIRSFIMIAFVLIAVLFDRVALSIRSLSLAAIVILGFHPEFIFSIGFQLSFTAVLILITLYQPFEKRFLNRLKSSFIGRFIRIILAFAIVSLFITCATTPLVLYHFNQFAPYGIVGNILTGLILSFWIMPFLFLGLFLMPIGLDAFCFKAAGIGISYVTAICDKIHQWPNAIVRVPSFNTTSLCLMMLGIILICFMKTRWRIIGAFFFLFGIGDAVLTPKPDVLIGDKGQTVAVRGENNELLFLSAKPHSQTAQLWLIKNGEEPLLKNISMFPQSILFIKGKRISLTLDTCQKSDICMHHLPKDQTYLIYISDKIKVKTP